MTRYRHLIGAILAVLVIVSLAACGSDTDDAPPSATPNPAPTRAPVVTVIVPPPPPATLTPIPTPAFELYTILGDWGLNLRVTIAGSDYTNELYYETNVRLHVDDLGQITGRGYLLPQIADDVCQAQVRGSDGLAFTVQGSVRQEAGQLVADLTLIPSDPEQAEHFTLICPTYRGDIRNLDRPVLWPALDALNLLTWTLPLDSGESASVSGDLSDAGMAPVNGTLTMRVALNR